MSINASSGSKIYICSTPTPAAADVSTYAALTWIEIDEVESIAAFGDKASSITFTSLNDARVRKLKGPRDAGDVDVVYAHDPSDAGQQALATAEGTKFSYPFKVTVPDAQDVSSPDSAFYFQAKVSGVPINPGSATDVTKRTATLAIDTAIVEDLTS